MDNQVSLADLGFDNTLTRAGALDAATTVGDNSANTITSPITDSLPSTSISSGDSSEILFSGKTSFTDTTDGYRQGVDTDGTYKWIVGSATSSADFNVTTANTFTVTGIGIVSPTISYGKTSFSDSTHAGYYLSSSGVYIGAASDTTAFKYTVATGSFDFIGTISSRSTATIASAINSSGNLITDLINARLDTSAASILTDFDFGSTNYAGAVLSGNVTWNTTTGAVTGGSGVVLYRKGIIGVSSGSTTFSIDATTGNATFLGSVTATSGSITGSFSVGAGLTIGSGGSLSSGQSAYNTGTGYWLEYNGGTPRFSLGDSSNNNLTWDGSALRIVGNLSATTTFTTSQLVESGNGVSVSSSTGLVSRTGVSDFGSQSSTTSVASNTPSGFNMMGAFISSTVRLMAYIENASTDHFTVMRIVVNPTTSGVTSATNFALATSTGNNARACDLIDLTTTTALIVTVDDSGRAEASVLSGLDTTVTQGARTVLSTSAYTDGGIAVAPVSATEAIVFYYVSATEVRGHRVTISGTSVTSSTTSTVYSTATNQYVMAAGKFGSAATYIVMFCESTTTMRAIAATYSGGSLTPGSAITVESFDCQSGRVIGIDSTRVITAYQRTSTQAITSRVLSVSGTTLTSNSGYSVATADANGLVSLAKLGKYSYVIGYCVTGRTNTAKLLDVTSTTVSQRGSTFTFGARANEFTAVPIYHAADRVLMVEVDGGGNYYASTIDLTNNYTTWVGIAVADAAASASCPVITHGITTNESGLSTGSLYYTDVDGALNTIAVGTRIGFASSSTNLIVRS